MSAEPEVPWEETETEGLPVRVPFSIASIRKITRQSLISFGPGRDPIRYGLTQKSAVLLSMAASAFIQHLASDVARVSQTGRITRHKLTNAIVTIPRYRFAVTRLRTEEVFPFLTDATELSKRVALSEIERTIRFPIEFVAPHAPGNTHTLDDREVSYREAANVEASIKAIVLAHHAYRQTIPDCLKAERYRLGEELTRPDRPPQNPESPS
jgi:hypothetical protein